MSGRTYTLKSIPNARFLRNLAVLFNFTVFARNLVREEVAEEIVILRRCLTCGLKRGLMSTKPIHYLLVHGDSIKDELNMLMIIPTW